MNEPDVTLLLQRLDAGDSDAGDTLFALVYDHLRARARRFVGGAAGTLQPTALVHEAWLKLRGPAGEGVRSRAHFFGVAAKAMRSVLVDHARSKAASKRPDEGLRTGMEEVLASYAARVPDLVALHEELEALGKVDAQLATIVELRFFAGLSIAETAEVMGVGHATVERGWRTARAHLASRLGPDPL